MSNQNDDGGGQEETNEKDGEPKGAPEESRSTSKPAKELRSKAASSSKRKAAASSAEQAKPAMTPARLALTAVVILGAGSAAGWFAHEAHAKAELRKEAAAQGEDGACGAWEQEICKGSGEGSPGCQQAKSATDLMTPSTCEVALQTVPATLSKMKAARASCDKLETKLCGDLSQGSQACQLVKQQTPTFMPSRCDAMLEQYDKVLRELQMLEQQMQQRGGPQMMSPQGAAPHAPPGAMPPPGAAAKAKPPQGAAPKAK